MPNWWPQKEFKQFHFDKILITNTKCKIKQKCVIKEYRMMIIWHHFDQNHTYHWSTIVATFEYQWCFHSAIDQTLWFYNKIQNNTINYFLHFFCGNKCFVSSAIPIYLALYSDIFVRVLVLLFVYISCDFRIFSGTCSMCFQTCDIKYNRVCTQLNESRVNLCVSCCVCVYECECVCVYTSLCYYLQFSIERQIECALKQHTLPWRRENLSTVRKENKMFWKHWPPDGVTIFGRLVIFNVIWIWFMVFNWISSNMKRVKSLNSAINAYRL